ncbi:thiamine-phosphate kinase [Lipingzhangella sp. LS1_29]|uniref:Thiamine-monophosphate kinase n=1 Tax=Lipingzhangella rawalii TaxID=2055835 RepID=A0ABU2H5R5_9ACTN|nr:thiamine-phosphate kinase [Lipingzhangella rawalii]MDS1270640.1 thiamine-phosphate kinase [Lipingzhangella rawalii]
MTSTIGDLGEFALIDRVTARFPNTEDVILGPGDDAAILRVPDGRVVASTDLLVEGRHFTREWSTGRDVGHKAVSQNLADVAAMAARPTSMLLGLALPRDLPLAWVDELTDGLAAGCRHAGVTVAGGDVVGSDTLTISVTAFGNLAPGQEPLRRSGARPGNVVAVCGRLGLSAAGLALVQRGLDEPAACIRAHLRPDPPLDAGLDAARRNATAMLDISDGLLQDLGHIAVASNVAIDLRDALLPRDPEVVTALARLHQLGAGPANEVEFVLGGGEDHALVATFPRDTDLGSDWIPIGHVTELPPQSATEHTHGTRVTVDGRAADIYGWDHLGARDRRMRGRNR